MKKFAGKDAMTTVLRSTSELIGARLEWAATGEKVGFVPTMGALHDGHRALLKEARQKSDIVVLSIYLNPAQFGAGEDLAQYPKTLESDLAMASEEGVNFVFTPKSSEMYPEGYSTYVNEEILSRELCGAYREGHFRGVTTIVLKLFNLVRPNLSVFGLKDAQQFFVLKKMLLDLNLDIEMIGVPTVREQDGLALSSRNAYLTKEERSRAPVLFETLRWCRRQILSGAFQGEVLKAGRSRIEAAGLKVQYLEIAEFPGVSDERRIAVAAFLGATRLIDNVAIS